MGYVQNPELSSAPPDSGAPVPLHCIAEGEYSAWRDGQPAATRQWLAQNGYVPERGRWLMLPAADGANVAVIVGLGGTAADAQTAFWLGAALADRLPSGRYRLAPAVATPALPFALGWQHGSYRYQPYKSRSPSAAVATLDPPDGVDASYIAAATRASALARDLINTPANDLGPAQLAAAVQALARRAQGTLTVVEGEALQQQYPLVAAVGAGSPRAPRLLDLHFPRAGAPHVALVGKGVCFDSGGLDIKPSAGMLLMKKDMGGAACALATAQLLRELDLPIDLRVLVPAVENSVDGASFRPGDIWKSRKGLQVEIGNTDAEGRLVLADALTAAEDRNPDLIIDFATLTGAARVALGAELPAAFSGDPALLTALMHAGQPLADPVWPMPLWEGYDDELGSRIADLNNAPGSGMAGSITAALFLRRFVARPARWIHLDLYGWNAKDRAGRPTGAEAQCVRAVAEMLRQRYA
jgi:leucyl aminopeptidase